MPIKCPHCGYDANRDQARFCRQCGTPLTTSPVITRPQVQPQPLVPPGQQGRPLQPHVQPQIRPIRPARPPSPWPRLPPVLVSTRPSGPLVIGTVTMSRERRDRPPTDWYKVLFISSLLLMFSPAIALGMALLCLVPAVAIAISIFISLFRRPSGPAEVPIYELSVDDTLSGRVVNVEMIGRRGGGSIEVGDEVEVYGQWMDPAVQDSVRAWEIHITHRYSPTQGKKVPSRAVVKAQRPFPPAVAIGAFVVAFMAILWACTALSSGY